MEKEQTTFEYNSQNYDKLSDEQLLQLLQAPLDPETAENSGNQDFRKLVILKTPLMQPITGARVKAESSSGQRSAPQRRLRSSGPPDENAEIPNEEARRRQEERRRESEREFNLRRLNLIVEHSNRSRFSRRLFENQLDNPGNANADSNNLEQLIRDRRTETRGNHLDQIADAGRALLRRQDLQYHAFTGLPFNVVLSFADRQDIFALASVERSLYTRLMSPANETIRREAQRENTTNNYSLLLEPRNLALPIHHPMNANITSVRIPGYAIANQQMLLFCSTLPNLRSLVCAELYQAILPILKVYYFLCVRHQQEIDNEGDGGRRFGVLYSEIRRSCPAERRRLVYFAANSYIIVNNPIMYESARDMVHEINRRGHNRLLYLNTRSSLPTSRFILGFMNLSALVVLQIFDARGCSEFFHHNFLSSMDMESNAPVSASGRPWYQINQPFLNYVRSTVLRFPELRVFNFTLHTTIDAEMNGEAVAANDTMFVVYHLARNAPRLEVLAIDHVCDNNNGTNICAASMLNDFLEPARHARAGGFTVWPNLRHLEFNLDFSIGGEDPQIPNREVLDQLAVCFPNLTMLSVTHINAEDIRFLAGRMPNLQILCVRSFDELQDIDIDAVREVLGKVALAVEFYDHRDREQNGARPSDPEHHSHFMSQQRFSQLLRDQKHLSRFRELFLFNAADHRPVISLSSVYRTNPNNTKPETFDVQVMTELELENRQQSSDVIVSGNAIPTSVFMPHHFTNEHQEARDDQDLVRENAAFDAEARRWITSASQEDWERFGRYIAVRTNVVSDLTTIARGTLILESDMTAYLSNHLDLVREYFVFMRGYEQPPHYYFRFPFEVVTADEYVERMNRIARRAIENSENGEPPIHELIRRLEEIATVHESNESALSSPNETINIEDELLRQAAAVFLHYVPEISNNRMYRWLRNRENGLDDSDRSFFITRLNNVVDFVLESFNNIQDVFDFLDIDTWAESAEFARLNTSTMKKSRVFVYILKEIKRAQEQEALDENSDNEDENSDGDGGGSPAPDLTVLSNDSSELFANADAATHELARTIADMVRPDQDDPPLTDEQVAELPALHRRRVVEISRSRARRRARAVQAIQTAQLGRTRAMNGQRVQPAGAQQSQNQPDMNDSD